MSRTGEQIKIKVSVIIPIYNAESYLRECIESVINQTLKEIEIICVDDGSQDSSRNIINEYISKDSRISLLEQSNKGAGAARNLGLKCAKGEYIAFLDSDDFFEYSMLQKVYSKSVASQAQIVVFKAKSYSQKTGIFYPLDYAFQKQYIPNKAIFSHQDMPEHIFNSFQVWTWNKLFNTDFLKDNNITFQEIFRSNDVLFTCETLVKAHKITVINEYLAYYRIDTETSSQDTNHLYPTAFYDALIATRDMLIREKKYNLLKKSFKNWALDVLIYNLHSIKDQKVFETTYRKIHLCVEKDFGFMLEPPKYYINHYNYDELILIITLIHKDYINYKASLKYKGVKTLKRIKRYYYTYGFKKTFLRILKSSKFFII